VCDRDVPVYGFILPGRRREAPEQIDTARAQSEGMSSKSERLPLTLLSEHGALR
jgi:hypothetical protein